MTYLGQERRRRQVVITSNTEYHLEGHVCVAVRDNRTGQLRRQHEALGCEMVGQVQVQSDGSWQLHVGGTIGVGQRLFFSSHLVTSPVRAVSRPGYHDN